MTPSAQLAETTSSVPGSHTFKKGDDVQMWFNTGAFGYSILYGVVIAAGPKTYRVRWESDLTNRIRQGDKNVKRREYHT